MSQQSTSSTNSTIGNTGSSNNSNSNSNIQKVNTSTKTPQLIRNFHQLSQAKTNPAHHHWATRQIRKLANKQKTELFRKRRRQRTQAEKAHERKKKGEGDIKARKHFRPHHFQHFFSGGVSKHARKNPHPKQCRLQ